MKLQNLEIYGDSELIIRQAEGIYQVKSEKLIPLHKTATDLLSKIPNVKLTSIPRSQNARADYLANFSMDNRKDIRTSTRGST